MAKLTYSVDGLTCHSVAKRTFENPETGLEEKKKYDIHMPVVRLQEDLSEETRERIKKQSGMTDEQIQKALVRGFFYPMSGIAAKEDAEKYAPLTPAAAFKKLDKLSRKLLFAKEYEKASDLAGKLEHAFSDEDKLDLWEEWKDEYNEWIDAE